MIHIALVEDEAEVRAQLQGYVQRHTRQYGTEFAVTEFADGMELLDDYRPVYDILFLDVEMKHLDGMETARRVRELDKDVIIVFITNMAQYAIGGYAVGALDYVLKPVPYFAFSQQLRKAEEQLRRRARHYLALPVEGGMRRLDSSLIYYLESEGHRVHFYTEEGDFVAAAVGIQYLYLWVTRTISLLEAGYVCARAFVLAELAASAEWQLHCFLWPQRSGADGLSLLLLVVVYGGVFGCIWVLEHKHKSPKGHIVISGKAALVAVVMAAMVFAVSNLLFLGDCEVDMSVYYIRTLVDICGVLILTVQHEQLREAALHSELAAMDEVLHRQYEQYKRSKEGIRLINSRYHELKIQIADIRAERDRAKQDAALARMESGLRQYEAENKTGNPVLDTLLTAKSMDCQQRGINMTSVADGSQLGFLSTRELCTLVGAPLDNAIESVLAEPDPEKRLLRVAIYNQSGCVMLRFENYCAQPVELGADGLPVHNAHGGYDLQGVQAAAQHHDGTMTLHWADGWFTLRILLPVPEK